MTVAVATSIYPFSTATVWNVRSKVAYNAMVEHFKTVEPQS
jgi:hypothetical protein